MDLQTQLQELKTSTQAKLAEMRGEHSKELQELRVAVLGKKGSLTELLKGLKDLPSEERPTVGKMVNEVRDVLTEAFDDHSISYFQTGFRFVLLISSCLWNEGQQGCVR